MKKALIITAVILVVIAAIVGGTIITWDKPLKLFNVDSSKIAEITVFDRGEYLHITDRADIDYIINSLNDCVFERDRIYTFRSGAYRVWLYDYDGKCYEEFGVTSSKMLNVGSMFYNVISGDDCYELFEELCQDMPLSKETAAEHDRAYSYLLPDNVDAENVSYFNEILSK